MFDFVFALIIVVFVAMFALTTWGFVRHMGMISSIFKSAQRRIDQQNAADEPPRRIECRHCGSQIISGVDCPNCGAAAG